MAFLVWCKEAQYHDKTVDAIRRLDPIALVEAYRYTKPDIDRMRPFSSLKLGDHDFPFGCALLDVEICCRRHVAYGV